MAEHHSGAYDGGEIKKIDGGVKARKGIRVHHICDHAFRFITQNSPTPRGLPRLPLASNGLAGILLRLPRVRLFPMRNDNEKARPFRARFES
jgi:hypothetical protein